MARSSRSKRNETEIEADRLFILSLLERAGSAISAIEVQSALNDRRRAYARQYTLALGGSEEDAERAAEEAPLSVQTVRTEIRRIQDRLREGTQAGAAAWLDDQISDVRSDYDRTFKTEDAIVGDLELSRTHAWRRQKGLPVAVGADNGDPPRKELQTVEVVRYDEERAALGSLYSQLDKILERRSKLRTEMRLLRFGRDWMRAVTVQEAEISQTFAQLVSGADESPGLAHDRVVEAYGRELQALCASSEISLGMGDPALVRMETARVRRQANRVRQLRDYAEFVDLSNGDEGREGRDVFITEWIVKKPNEPLPEPTH